MSGWHTVKQGDCVHSLAAKEGIPLNRILEASENEQLFSVRERTRENMLVEDDRVFIPEREARTEQRPTDERHRFKYIRPIIELRVEINEMGQARADEPYWVEIDGKRHDGLTERTDQHGLVQCRLPADTAVAVIVIGELEDEYETHLGHNCPPDTRQGVHARLWNLGLLRDGEIDRSPDGDAAAGAQELLGDEAPQLVGGDEANWIRAIGTKIAEAYGS